MDCLPDEETEVWVTGLQVQNLYSTVMSGNTSVMSARGRNIIVQTCLRIVNLYSIVWEHFSNVCQGRNTIVHTSLQIGNL